MGLDWMMAILVGILGVAAAGAAVVLAVAFFGISATELSDMGVGTVPLTCPHCGAQTPSNLPECEACHKSFREESCVPRPVIDSPKVRAMS